MRTLLAVAPLLSIPLVFTQPTSQAEDWPFADPEQGLSIPASNTSDGGGWQLDQLLVEYGDLTGTTFVWTSDTRNLLASTPVPIEQAVDVPPASVHKIVETLIYQTGFIFSLANESEPRMVTVHAIGSTSRRAQPITVDRADLDRWSDHPAHLIQTVLTLPHTDVRTLTNSMRAMLSDAGTQSIIPVGNTHSMILSGPAATVTRLTGLLEQIEGAAEEHAKTMRKALAEQEAKAKDEKDTPEHEDR